METYTEMKKRHQDEVNALPLMFAFSDKQFEEGCKKLGVTDPAKELYRLGMGSFYRKTDSKLIHETFDRHDEEMNEAMKNEDFAVSAFEYEAGNHEYHINLDPDYDMANCFGYPCKHNGDRGTIEWDKIENGDFLKKCYKKGVSKFLKTARY